MKQVILNVAVGTGHYKKSQQRLCRTLDQFAPVVDRIIRTDYPPGCPTHQIAPWGFKPYIFCEARELGYTHAI